MDQLWAPWRGEYVVKPPPKSDDCFICRGLSESNDRASGIVLRTIQSVVLLNRFPYNNGHLLVAPRSHQSGLDDLDSTQLADVIETVRLMTRTLQSLLKPDGFNIGLNLGQAAGAGLPGHLHWHIVPRWVGDVNFMPAVGNVKVISQSLDALWELLTTKLANSTNAKPQSG
jgi:ATP adenylyltransferase